MVGTEQELAVSSLSFEDALGELETIVRQLEEGSAKLDEAIAAYERGVALRRWCEAKLGEAQGRVDQILVGPGGDLLAEPITLD